MRTCCAPLAFIVALCSASAFAAAPLVFWASDPVRPGEVVVVQGGRWGKQPKVNLSRAEAAKFSDTQTLRPLQSSDDSLKFLLPAAWKPGIYRFQIEADGAKSAPVTLNAPDPWWQQGDWGQEASPGGWLRIFGKCLSFDEGHAGVLLRRDGFDVVTLKPTQQDTWSVNVALPSDLSAGEYEVFVHNGYGDQADWRAAGKIRIAPHARVWKSDVFDVTKFGAVANDGMDDTYAVQKALDAAAANGGGIVFFPRGRFQMNDPVRIPRRVLVKGGGHEFEPALLARHGRAFRGPDIRQQFLRDRRPLDHGRQPSLRDSGRRRRQARRGQRDPPPPSPPSEPL